ncbi:uncharacterized protein LOC128668277 [Microplitis demolitor]|uniref:uncharacterized protein LOC128668277 n=1 Tax=Microplitis demolitor TaxID=69319 RepID=UPI00043FFEDC|nr:uncharacterized protein LOC128668277 [Microplitis demolitor]
MSKILLIFAFSALLSCVMGQNFEDPYYKLRIKEQRERITNMLNELAESTTKSVETTTEKMETTTETMETTTETMETTKKPKESTTKAVEATTKSYESTTNSDNLKNLEDSSSTPKNCLVNKMLCFIINDQCCPGTTCVPIILSFAVGTCVQKIL